MPLVNLGDYPFGRDRPAPALIDPVERTFVAMLRAQLKNGGRPPAPTEIEKAFGPDPGSLWRRAAALHVAVWSELRDAQGSSFTPAATRLDDLASAHGFAPGLVRDLACELNPHAPDLTPLGRVLVRGWWRPERHSLTAPLLLMKPGNSGVVAWLTVELIAEGTGMIHEAPPFAFLPTDRLWENAGRDARLALGELLPATGDLRWSLAFRGGLPLLLGGASAGALLGLAGAQLLGQGVEAWSGLDLTGVSATACLSPEGHLTPVAGHVGKLVAAARNQDFPRIGVVLVAWDQLAEIASDPLLPGAQLDAKAGAITWPGHEFTVLGAKTLAEAAAQLRRHRSTHLPGIVSSISSAERTQLDDEVVSSGPTLAPQSLDYVHRPELDEILAPIVAGKSDLGDRGVILFIGAAGTGKTEWLTGHLHERRRAGTAPIFFFVAYRSASAGASATTRWEMARSFYYQLRRYYGLPDGPGIEPHSQNDSHWCSALRQLLTQVAERAVQAGQPAVLYIEAADQMLETETLISGLFQPKLPQGVWLIVTSRQNTHFLDNPENLHRFHFQTLEPLAAGIDPEAPDHTRAAAPGYRAAVRKFLQLRNARLDPPLREELIEGICTSETLPTFKTVRDRVRLLAGKLEAEPGKADEVRRRVEPWLLDADQRAVEEADLFERRLGQLPGAAVADGWLLLGIIDALEVGKTSVGRPDLVALLKAAVFLPLAAYESERAKAVDAERCADDTDQKRRVTSLADQLLRLAANFFRDRGNDRPQTPYRIEHPSYNRLVRDRCREHGIEPFLHRIMAAACDSFWSDSTSQRLRDYALDRRVAHHAATGDGARTCAVLADVPFLVHKLGARGWGALQADAFLACQRLPGSAFAQSLAEWERFLRQLAGAHERFWGPDVPRAIHQQILIDAIHNEYLR